MKPVSVVPLVMAVAASSPCLAFAQAEHFDQVAVGALPAGWALWGT